MNRADGKRVKDIPAFDRIIPQVMNRRCDATNYGKFEFDMGNLRAFLRKLRTQGHNVGVMDAVIAAYVFLLQRTPELNRFIVNKKLYQRNHICISFTMLKRAPGSEAIEETAVKVYLEQDDDLIAISQKIRAVIKENETPQTKNNMDNFVKRLASVPFLLGFLMGCIKFLDRRGILPRSILDLSPFHTTLYVSNLASIQMGYVYHHLYEFGTAGIFITMGKPQRAPGEGKEKDRIMTLGVAFDERICYGAVWARAFYDFKRALEHPERFLGTARDETCAEE